jgi:SAM-dependent methyltransferase
MPRDPTARFSDRVENYVRYRPTYPDEVLKILREATGLSTRSVIADIGSGTGILSDLFIRNGNAVFGVEPNTEMRLAAEARLRQCPNFHSIVARAEATTLENGSVDYVVAGQAFHWFDIAKCRQEFARILRPGGWVVLVWNSRHLDTTPFLRAYDVLLRIYGTDYLEIQHKKIDGEVLRTFFAGGKVDVRRVHNEQRFDFEGLKGRLLSSSYAPSDDHPKHQPMLCELEKVFSEHAVDGQISFEYDTELFFGHLS